MFSVFSVLLIYLMNYHLVCVNHLYYKLGAQCVKLRGPAHLLAALPWHPNLSMQSPKVPGPAPDPSGFLWPLQVLPSVPWVTSGWSCLFRAPPASTLSSEQCGGTTLSWPGKRAWKSTVCCAVLLPLEDGGGGALSASCGWPRTGEGAVWALTPALPGMG